MRPSDIIPLLTMGLLALAVVTLDVEPRRRDDALIRAGLMLWGVLVTILWIWERWA